MAAEENTAKPDAEGTIVELDELLVRPGTYFNPQTEVIVVVDDSASIDQEVFNMEVYEGVDWVRVSDEIPIDEAQRDELLEVFQTHYHPQSAATSPLQATDEDLESDETPAAAADEGVGPQSGLDSDEHDGDEEPEAGG